MGAVFLIGMACGSLSTFGAAILGARRGRKLVAADD
jgi:hypothetical protein